VLVLADLDHFKNINDSFGHAVGDQVIAAFARVLRDSARTSREAVVGRVGGEEFGAFLFGNVVEGQLYGEIARRTFASLQFDDIAPHGQFTASFGVAELQRGEPLPKLTARADSALYEAKRNGRNRVQVAHALSVVQDNDAPKTEARGSLAS
jgi:diguanylate cyclase (GGDEF)-like protein